MPGLPTVGSFQNLNPESPGICILVICSYAARNITELQIHKSYFFKRRSSRTIHLFPGSSTIRSGHNSAVPSDCPSMLRANKINCIDDKTRRAYRDSEPSTAAICRMPHSSGILSVVSDGQHLA